MKDLVEVSFTYDTVKLIWRHKENRYVEARIKNRVIHYKSVQENNIVEGIDDLYNPKKFPDIVQQYKKEIHTTYEDSLSFSA